MNGPVSSHALDRNFGKQIQNRCKMVLAKKTETKGNFSIPQKNAYKQFLKGHF